MDPSGSSNPYIPATSDVSWALVAGLITLALVVLFVVALVSILRSTRYSGTGKIAWVLITLVATFIGPIVWFAWGRTASMNPPLGADPSHPAG